MRLKGFLILSLGILFSVCSFSTFTHAADYPKTIPPKISECYAESVLNDRYRRHPLSMDGLISLIKKVELHPTVRLWDTNTLVTTLLRRFRYDGIEDAESQTSFTTPIQKNLPETDKYSLIWTLIPGDASIFPEDALTAEEKCALHFMLSYSVNSTMRAEERYPRQLPSERSVDDFEMESFPRGRMVPVLPQLDDVPKDEKDLVKAVHKQEETVTVQGNEEGESNFFDNNNNNETVFDRPMDINPTDEDNEEAEAVSESVILQRKRREASLQLPVSKSPLQLGVVSTPYGTVAAGVVLAGIAAGLEPQTIKLGNWISHGTYNWSSSVLDRYVSNIWASTIASDIAQSGLLRIHLSHTTVGPSGRWNDTVGLCPREYALDGEDPSYLTNAEIYGGIDGLLLGLKLKTWDKDYLKLSSLLSAYYSDEGLQQDRSYRACNRINNFRDPNKVDHVMLKEEALTFLVAYYDKDTDGNPVFKPTTDRFAKAKEFIDTTYSDLMQLIGNPEAVQENFTPCSGSATLPIPETPKTDVDITFVVDQYTYSDEDVKAQTELAGWIALNLNIGQNASQLGIVSSYDGNALIMKNQTNKALLACEIRSKTIPLQNQRKLHTVLSTLKNTLEKERSEEKASKISGAGGKVLLFSITGRSPSTQDMESFKKEYDLFKEAHPDVRLMFAAAGAVSTEAYRPFVTDPEKDIFKLNFFSNYKEAAVAIAKRMRSVSARLFYPECSKSVAEGTYSHSIYVTPGTQKHFKIMPSEMNLSSNLKLTFTVLYGNAEVCLSRNQEPPNPLSALSICKTAPETGGTLEFTNYKAPCAGGGCTPIYVSVKAPEKLDGIPCEDIACESAEQVKVIWSHTGMICSKDTPRSGAHSLVAASQTILVTIITTIFVFNYFV